MTRKNEEDYNVTYLEMREKSREIHASIDRSRDVKYNEIKFDRYSNPQDGYWIDRLLLHEEDSSSNPCGIAVGDMELW